MYKAKSAFDSYEAIVRDCAKVCNDRQQEGHDDGVGPVMCAQRILTRYGLTELPTEQLVSDRVGLIRGPHK
jgi:hypothetical protein